MQDMHVVLDDLNNGNFLRDGAEQLEELVRAVEKVNGKGVLTMKLIVASNEDGTASVRGEWSMKKPARKRGAQEFFMQDGDLTKDSPKQLKLAEVRSLEGVEVKVREIK